MNETTLFLQHLSSPLGTYILVSSRQGLVGVMTESHATNNLRRWKQQAISLIEDGRHNEAVAEQLSDYFAGRRRQFNLPLDLRGTSFQCQVWEALITIPYGETRSYLEVAQAIDRPKAARAVGQAIGNNPISIIIPCHRVIGADGKLTGYGGGLHRKQALLELETSTLASPVTT